MQSFDLIWILVVMRVNWLNRKIIRDLDAPREASRSDNMNQMLLNQTGKADNIEGTRNGAGNPLSSTAEPKASCKTSDRTSTEEFFANYEARSRTSKSSFNLVERPSLPRGTM